VRHFFNDLMQFISRRMQYVWKIGVPAPPWCPGLNRVI